MRVPVSWLREFVELPADVSARDIADALIRLGLEVEAVDSVGAQLRGPLRIGRVLKIEELTDFKKPIRWCEVDVGDVHPRGVICGAINFDVGDIVVMALPGAMLPGGFEITSRRTYGRISDGMICSSAELGFGNDHVAGILKLDPDFDVGADAIERLELRDDVLDIAVTPDRGYCLSIRGVAREVSHGLSLGFRDPAGNVGPVPLPDTVGWPVRIDDPSGCDRFSARTVTAIDPNKTSPFWLRRRLLLCGMRPISLTVDVTNYVMLEIGQPLHAFDRKKLRGPLCVRRANSGERLTTLDGQDRVLEPDDLLVSDDSGPLALAGVMGGAGSEVSASTTDIVLEAAHWDPPTVMRMARRHKLASEAARRFERGVDIEVAAAALTRAAALLEHFAGAAAERGFSVVGVLTPPRRIVLPSDRPEGIAGRPLGRAAVTRRLIQIGATVGGDTDLVVTPPSWRPDLVDPADLVEEVIRLEGYDTIPSVLPQAPAGKGLTDQQRAERRIGRELADGGYVEVLTSPFISPHIHDSFGLPDDDPRRGAVHLLNPLSEEEPELRTSLLPGLLTTLRRNISRGQRDIGLFEIGMVYFKRPGNGHAPALPVDHRPSDDDVARLMAVLPDQPKHVAVVLVGQRDPAGWWGKGRPALWADAVEAARTVGRAARVPLDVRSTRHAPWHPGRCAELRIGDVVVGHAGELHPRVLTELELPPRVSAMELNLESLGLGDLPLAPSVSSYPPTLLDVALVVSQDVPAAEVESALRDGAGRLLEDLQLFDVYEGKQLGSGQRSLAYSLRFRAPNRTLTVEEATEAKDAAVAEVNRRTGAVIRT